MSRFHALATQTIIKKFCKGVGKDIGYFIVTARVRLRQLVTVVELKEEVGLPTVLKVPEGLEIYMLRPTN